MMSSCDSCQRFGIVGSILDLDFYSRVLVAQLDRALASEAKGCRFDSRPGRFLLALSLAFQYNFGQCVSPDSVTWMFRRSMLMSACVCMNISFTLKPIAVPFTLVTSFFNSLCTYENKGPITYRHLRCWWGPHRRQGPSCSDPSPTIQRLVSTQG